MLKKISLILIILLLVTGCQKTTVINNLSDLDNQKVGVYTGSEYDKIVSKELPNSTPAYYNNYNDQIIALKSSKISALLTDEPLAKEILKNNEGLKILDTKLTEDSYAFAINKDQKELKKQIDKILTDMKESNKLKELEDKWFGDDESKKVLEKYNYKSSKKIKFGTVSTSAPFSYMKNNEVVGYVIDIINYIGYKLNYEVEIVDMAFEGIIPAVVSNKVDVAGCSIIITEDRKKSVLFSIPNYTGGIVVVTKE